MQYLIFAFILVISFTLGSLHTNTTERAYNMLLTERTFGNQTHCYALLGLEMSSGSWNLLGGQREPGDKTRGITAARELFEESAMMLDKRGQVSYWSNLSSYEFGAHKVFIHDPKNLDINIKKLNDTVQKVLQNPNFSRDYKEMSRYQLIKLTDLMDLARAQTFKGKDAFFKHPEEKNPMKIDGWVLYTLQKADTTQLNKYKY